MKAQFTAMAEAAALATGHDRRGHVLGRRDDDAQQPRPRRALPREHGRLRHRRHGRRPECRQHRHGQRQLGLPDHPPGPRDLRARACRATRSRSATRRRRRGPTRRRCSRRRSSPRRRTTCSLDPALVEAAWAAFRARLTADRRAGERRPPDGRVLPSAAARPAGRSDREPAAPPIETADPDRGRIGRPRPSPEDPVAERPHDPRPTSRAANGWDREYETYSDFDLPTYVGAVDVHEAAVDHRSCRAPPRATSTSRSSARRSTMPSATARAPGSGRARSARRSTRRARSTRSSSTSSRSTCSTVVDAGDANIVPAWIERGHAMIYRKVREVAETGAIPIILGGDHSITWPSATADRRGPPAGQHRHRPLRRPRRHGQRRLRRARQPRDADAPARSSRARSTARTSSRSACAATGRRSRRSSGCASRACAGTSCARSRSAARRRSSPRRSTRRSTAPTAIYLSLDIDVIDPGMAPGTGTPEPGGMLTREVLRADPPDRRRGRARRRWTSSRSRRHTTTPRPPRWPRTAPPSRRSAPSP